MKRLSTGKKTVFACIAIALFLGGLELAARGVGLVQSLRQPRANDDPVVRRFRPLRYELTPNRSIPANGATAWINSVGIRGAEPDSTKTRRRVLCLGDSCTFGYGPDVTDAATYPALLGQRLDTTSPGRFEVLNGGMPSYCSLDCLNFLLWRGVELNPDVVVIFMGWNDSHECQPIEAPPPSIWPRSRDYSALIRLGEQAATRWIGPRALDPAALRRQLERLPTPTDHLTELIFKRCERITADVVRMCRAQGALPILVTLPNFSRDDWQGTDSLTDRELVLMMPHLAGGHLSPKGWRRFITRTNQGIASVARRLDVPLVDGAEIRDLDLFVDLCHLNADGNAVLAERVAKTLEAIHP